MVEETTEDLLECFFTAFKPNPSLIFILNIQFNEYLGYFLTKWFNYNLCGI